MGSTCLTKSTGCADSAQANRGRAKRLRCTSLTLSQQFVERRKHEGAFVDERMGDREMGRLEAEIIEVEDIDVDIAGAFVDDFDAAHGAFDALGAAEQFDEIGRAHV